MKLKPKCKAQAVKARKDRIPYPPIVPPTAAQRQEAERVQEPIAEEPTETKWPTNIDTDYDDDSNPGTTAEEAERAQEPPKKAQRAELVPPWRHQRAPPLPPRQESSAASTTSTSTLGERPKYIPDPTPNYAGCDFESWINQEMIQYWEQLSPEDQSSEFHAQRRAGKWNKFKHVVFHAKADGSRRAPGGKHRAFFDQKNAGMLSKAEIIAYHKAKNELKRCVNWTEL